MLDVKWTRSEYVEHDVFLSSDYGVIATHTPENGSLSCFMEDPTNLPTLNLFTIEEVNPGSPF
jgi:transglutaminase/protease-like cytokinesis protein 3